MSDYRHCIAELTMMPNKSPEPNQCLEPLPFDIEGSDWLTYTEPIKIIADMRKELAEKHT